MQEIARYAIYPPVGIARVGDSPDGSFIGPEVPGPFERPDGGYKDERGRIKRQAAKFRIYGLNAKNEAVQELTAGGDVEIQWTVHLANKKGAWYCIKFAMDIPEAESVPRRNPDYKGDRRNLIVDPGPRSVNAKCPEAAFDTGTFLGVNVPLGEISIDPNGHLKVLGGLGNSESVSNRPVGGFDSEEWYDDNADGPVTAQVRIKGEKVEVEPAWVIVGPPDYAPGIRSVVTMYDLMYDVAVTHLGHPTPEVISFTEHIYPILEAVANLQWVNLGLYLEHGWGSVDHFLDPHNLRKLADASLQNKAFREGVFKKFRNPDDPEVHPDALPLIYGDAMDLPPPENNPRKMLSLTRLQHSWLQMWADGEFESDYEGDALKPQRLEDLPVSRRPEALIRAAMETCQGGPFHPGCEAPWIMRQCYLYESAFRIKHRSAHNPEKDYGEFLSPQETLSCDGPLNGSGPGDITRWMAIPWQADAFGCGSGFEPQVNIHLPTFWPARVPNHVLTERSYKKMLKPNLSNSQRFKYFSHRQEWLRHLSLELPEDKRSRFVEEWSKLGILTSMSTPGGIGDIPAEVFVEMNNLNEPEPIPDPEEERE